MRRTRHSDKEIFHLDTQGPRARFDSTRVFSKEECEEKAPEKVATCKRFIQRPMSIMLGILGIISIRHLSAARWFARCIDPLPGDLLPAQSKLDSHFNLKNAIEKIKARNAYLCTNDTDISQWKLGGAPAFHKNHPTGGNIIALLSPVYTCPWTLHRTNYVSEYKFDGGKWTCGVVDMYKERERRACIVYSFGSNNDDFFERGLLELNPDCEIHIFDPTSGDPPQEWEGKYHFHPIGLCVGDKTSFRLGRKNYPCKSLQGHMLDLGHVYVDIFKADVEGTEWELTKHWDDTRIGQVLLEFHFWAQSPALPSLLPNHIIPLERAGYFIHTLEPVAAVGNAFEVAFLNVNWSPEGINRGIFNASMYPSTTGVPNSFIAPEGHERLN